MHNKGTFFLLIAITIFCQNFKATGQVSFVKDPNIKPYTQSSLPRFFTEFNGDIYFTSKTFDKEGLVKYDPETSEVTLIKNQFYEIKDLVATDELMYFIAFSNNYEYELWKSDGTAEGTEVIGDFFPFSKLINISNLKVLNNKVVYQVYEEETGNELWVSDGTVSGTHILNETLPGKGGAIFSEFIAAENYLFFVVDLNSLGKQVWRSDGTSNGTIKLTDFDQIEFELGRKSKISVVEGIAYFSVFDKKNSHYFLWQTDGSVEETKPLTSEILLRKETEFDLMGPVHYQGHFYFINYSLQNRKSWVLWKKTIGDQPFELVHEELDSPLSRLVDLLASGTKLFIIINKSFSEDEIWSSDGTSENTFNVTEVKPKSADPNYKIRDGKLFFQNGFLWSINGVLDNKIQVSNVPLPYNVKESFNVINNKVYFSGINKFPFGSDIEFMVSDGTSETTTYIEDVNKTPLASKISNLSSVNNLLLFTADNGANGIELWVSDGTENNTKLLKDLYPGSNISFRNSSQPHSFFNFNDKIYFTAETDSPEPGVFAGLWKSDGTEEGTMLVKKLHMKFDGKGIVNKVKLNDKFYFSASKFGNSDYGIWSSEGTEENTLKLEEELDLGTLKKNRNPFGLTKSGNTIYFIGTDDETGRELWKINENDKIEMVKEINPGFNHAFKSEFQTSQITLTHYNNELYFAADDGIHGFELWKSDGTEEGTIMIKDILIGEAGSNPLDLKVYNDALYFVTTTEENGRQLWKTDGSTEGTTMVKDDPSSVFSSFTRKSFQIFKDHLFFGNYEPSSGLELWKSDGTETGTTLYSDVNEGPFHGAPKSPIVIDEVLYFTAFDADNISKIWKTTGDNEVFVIEGFDDAGLINPNNLYEFNGDLYFSALDPVKGESLFKYEFTEAAVTGIDDMITNPLVVYPNPSTTGNFNVKLPSAITDKPFELAVFDLTGRKVSFKNIANNHAQLSIQLGSHQKGLYLLQLKTDNEKYTQRFIHQ